MGSFAATPFVRIVLAWISGILLAYYAVVPIHWVCIPVLLLALMASYKLQRRTLVSVSAALLIAVLGYFHFSLSSTGDEDNSMYPVKTFSGRITAPPVSKPRSTQLELEIQMVLDSSGWHKTEGRAIVYVSQSGLQDFQYGDQVIVNGSLTTPAQPLNPGQFDFGEFLRSRGVTHVAYVQPDDITSTGFRDGNPIVDAALAGRRFVMNLIDERMKDQEVNEVAKALLVGYRDDMSDETRESYAASGTIHVLAVSGLHVGIIYGLFFLLLKRASGKSRIIIILSAALSIWAYAAITGLSPPVQRASIMFSTLLLAELIRKQTNIWNTLAFSAFLILYINPFELFQVGFQLSFAAVIGIVFFQPRIYSWFDPQNWLMDKVWMLLSVSLSAQVVTLPLVLYYFHLFPTYFLVSNLLVVPMIPVIIYSGFVAIALNFIPGIGTLLWKVPEYSVRFINEVVDLLSGFPLAQLEIPIDLVLAMFLTLVTIFLMLMIARHKISWFRWAVAIVLGAILYTGWVERGLRKRRQLVVYSNSSPVIDLVESFRKIRFAGDIDQETERYVLKPAATSLKHPDVTEMYSMHANQIIRAGSNSMLVSDDIASVLPHAPNVDIVFVTGGYRFADSELLKNKTLIFGYRCSSRFKDMIRQTAPESTLLHDLRVDGAFITEL